MSHRAAPAFLKKGGHKQRTKLGSTRPSAVKPSYRHGVVVKETAAFTAGPSKAQSGSCSKDPSSPMGFRKAFLEAR